jgi:lipoprotein-releasing system ATP-binding protein
MAFIEASSVDKSYMVGTARLAVLRDLSLAVERGEMVAVVGASGVGKSTLLHVLGGLDKVDAGLVRIGDADLAAMHPEALTKFRNKHVGFVFQFHHLLPEFTALENAGMPLRIAGRPAAERDGRARAMLERVGLGPRMDHKPGMLSGGEQQRVAIARALVYEPALLLADEPTGDLDEHTAETLHALLREMHRERGLTSIIATHNPRLAAACDRVLRLEEGKLRPVPSI